MELSKYNTVREAVFAIRLGLIYKKDELHPDYETVFRCEI